MNKDNFKNILRLFGLIVFFAAIIISFHFVISNFLEHKKQEKELELIRRERMKIIFR